MYILNIIGNTLQFIGFIILINTEDFINLWLYWNKKLDTFGQRRYSVTNEKWNYKYKPVLATIILAIGTLLNLVSSIVK